MSDLFKPVWFSVTTVFLVYDFVKATQRDAPVAFAVLLPMYVALGAALAWDFA